MYNRNIWKNSTCRKILLLTEIAKQGNIEAQFELGMSYLKGEGIPGSAVKAAKWLYKAAIQGNMEAQFELGILYQKGEGVKRSTALVTKWFCKAAVQGHRKAQYSSVSN